MTVTQLPGPAAAEAAGLRVERDGAVLVLLLDRPERRAEFGNWPSAQRFDRQRPIADAVRSSADAKEGAAAFVEKRAPQWTGR